MTGPGSSDDWSFDLFPDDRTDTEREPKRRPAFKSRSAARPGGIAPPTRALRLGGAVAVLVAVTVVIASVASGNSEGAADRAYLTRLVAPADQSQAVGVALVSLLDGKLQSYESVESSLNQLLQRQQAALSAATAIRPSPTLRTEYQQVIDALQFRADGLAGLLNGIRDASTSAQNAGLADILSMEAGRLIASDVLWEDEVVKPAKIQAAHDGATDVSPPPSIFLSNTALASAATMAGVLNKLHSPTTATKSTQLLKSGDTGPAVSAWQRSLNKWLARQSGQTLLTVNGTFDQATVNATQALQTAEQITVDGVVGPATRSALTHATASG